MLSIINIDDSKTWDNIVTSFKDYDVNYLSGYVKAFNLQDEGIPLLFYYNDGKTKAINVVMKRDIALAHPFNKKLQKNTFFDISTPYGYGGFWIEGEDYESVNTAYNEYCSENGFVSEFVRFHLFSNFQSHYSGVCESYTRNVVRTLEMSTDEILMDFEHRARKSLKKSNKFGLEVEVDSTGTRLDDFLSIYYSTMDRNNAKENYYFPKEFFEKINKLIGNYVYIHILYEGRIISTELVLYGTENCYSFLGGTNRDYFHTQANTLLKYEIIKWAKAKGLKRFILGGGYGADDGIFKYKRSFAPNGVVDFYIGKKIFNKEMYEELMDIRDIGPDTTDKFFPRYRAELSRTYELKL